MDKIEDGNKNIDIKNFLLIDSNRKKLNFNTFRMPLNFLSDIYNGETSLKEAEFFQRILKRKMEELGVNYKPKNAKEEEEIDGVLMLGDEILEYRDKIVDGFSDGTFSSEHFKKIR